MLGGSPISRDSSIAAIVAACAFALYVATLLPDLGGPEDSPKFQFLGYVLGTAHPPGYPLYLILTHVFVQLPIRTVAYRANLFSAVMAALACAVAYLIARWIGAGRWIGSCTALAAATGLSFWRSAVFAEVYSLAAAMVALTIALLLSWGARPSPKRLVGAVAAFAAGLGNHLTIVGLLPAGAWYILVRHRKALTLRLVALSIGVLFLGVCQYGFIVLRTRQGAPYLESRADSISDLITVVTAQRFADQRFSFGPLYLLRVQLPAAASAIRDEMGILGALLLAMGIAGAIWRKNSQAMLVVGAAAGLLVMVINLTGDFQGFITSMMVLLWPLAALGIQTAVDFGPAPTRRLNLRAAALVAAAALPVTGVLANYKASDHSRDDGDARFLRAVYAQLPEKAGIIAENYWYAMALNYLAFTGEIGPDRGVAPVDSWAAAVREAKVDGRRVFGFAGAATFLGAEGLQFRRAALEGPSLNEWLKGLPKGSLLVGATVNTPLPMESLPIDRAHAPPLGQFHPVGAFAWVAGERNAVVEVADVKSSVERGKVTATAERERARIELDGHDIVDVDEGMALAVFSPDGALMRTLEFGANAPLRVPFLGALYEFQGEDSCVDVMSETWTDITPVVAAGSWVTMLDQYRSVSMETELDGVADPHLRTRTLMGDGKILNTGQTRTADGRVVFLTDLDRPGFQRSLFRISLDQHPTTARVRLKPGAAVASVRLCADFPTPLFSGGTTNAVLRADFESEPYFGPGWSGPDRTESGTVRHTDGTPSTLLLPLETGFDYRLVLILEADKDVQLSITGNGEKIGECVFGTREPCTVTLPRAAVREGVNRIALWTSNGNLPGRPDALTFRGARLRKIMTPEP